ncbi:RsmD family RNA methyltransferase [Candidatus Saccharibacteria bacterium]|nr:RsmD family RNA methyltransferase [Candidatus Saccharibacteria bacterium]
MDTIRITSGDLRGRSVKSPSSKLTHPMGSREKLALFNMIDSNLSSARVLDAFAGSGALGIEALSRGANEVVFIEKAPKVAHIISENLKSLDLLEKAEVYVGDVDRFTTNELFDVVIADPPYDKFEIEKINNLTKLLKDDGTLVLSHPGTAPEFRGLKLTKSRKYAAASISIYVKNV